MRLSSTRIAIVSLTVLLGLSTTDASRGSDRPARHPETLVILSSTDVKGMMAPCGCHVPKGGLARRASFADSMRAAYDRVLLVDDGGFFPNGQYRPGDQVPGEAAYRDQAIFQMDAMKRIGVDAVGVGDRELRFGLSYLRENAKSRKLDLVCANLMNRGGRTPALPPFLIRSVGPVKVGVFGLMSDQGDLGPSHDSLAVEEPGAAARRTVAELKRRGATVIVLLSQLGKVESEDLVNAVDGIDAVVIGRAVPLLQRGRLIKHTVACYGGEQGHYIGVTRLTLDARNRVTSGDNETFMLGPDVVDRPDILQMVKTFQDSLDAKQHKTDKG
jgi:2',3'-cyclic-nucleotide 2'-phosphodiesterase (5'-nucleotidase family)